MDPGPYPWVYRRGAEPCKAISEPCAALRRARYAYGLPCVIAGGMGAAGIFKAELNAPRGRETAAAFKRFMGKVNF